MALWSAWASSPALDRARIALHARGSRTMRTDVIPLTKGSVLHPLSVLWHDLCCECLYSDRHASAPLVGSEAR